MWVALHAAPQGEEARSAVSNHDMGCAARLNQGAHLDRQRLDKWLWHVRVVKARTSAAALVEGGKVRVNGERQKSPGHGIKIGDVITVTLDQAVRVMKVEAFSERRGDATAARVLYTDLQHPPE